MLVAGCWGADPPAAGGGAPKLTEDGPPCVATERSAGNESIDLVEGRVRVPVGGGASDAGGGAGGREMPVFEYEGPARNRQISLEASGSDGVVGTTQTDARGRWCLQKPSSISFGEGLYASVTIDGVELRAPVIRARGTTISVRSEAMIRWLEAGSGRDWEAWSRARMLNLEAVVTTEADLISPVMMRGDESLETIVKSMVSDLKASGRAAQIVSGRDQRRGGDAGQDVGTGKEIDQRDSTGIQ